MSVERDRARHLRCNLTDAEKAVWDQLRGRKFAGHKFRRQVPIGPYIADFVCYSCRLIVELDGVHHADPQQRAHDERRTAWLASQGFRVLRFANEEVRANVDAVEAAIRRALRSLDGAADPLTPGPSPAEGRGEITNTGCDP